MHRLDPLVPLLVTLLGTASMAAEYDLARRHPAAVAGEATEQRILVRLRDASPAANSAPGALAQRRGLRLLESRALVAGLHALRVTPAAAGESVQATLTRLRADPAVQYAEADQRRYPHASAGDPLFAGQWTLQAEASTPSAVNAAGAWDTSTGNAGVVIAELDTGVRFEHPDLLRAGHGGRLLPGYDFISDVQVANDGDGRDADASDPGDWVTSAEKSGGKFSSCDVVNSSWHGTRVAGLLGAITNNGAGIAGLNWSGWILPVRVLGKCGGTDSDILAAMLWAAGLHVDGVPDNPFPAKIINMSLGGAGTCPTSYQTVISQLTAAGVLVVVSAGNEGGPVDVPANCPGVAAIAGLRHIGTKVGFSSLGPEIALSAPGGNCVNVNAGEPCLYSIHTTYNTGATAPGGSAYTDQTSVNVGTSFSAPIVAGIAGLMKAVNGNLGSAQLIARLREGSSRFPTSSSTTPNAPQCHVPAGSGDLQTAECICTTLTCGAGMANARGALDAALRPIAAIAVSGAVSPGQNIVLDASGSAAACGHAVSAYHWSIASQGGGTSAIATPDAPRATVLAPATGSLTVHLTVTDDAGRTDGGDVVLSANAVGANVPATAGSEACPQALRMDATDVASVGVAPVAATVLAGATQAFTATVMNTGRLAVTWQVNGIAGGNASIGTISSTGLYTAPATLPAQASVTVSAALQSDSTVVGTASVALVAASGGSSASAASSGSVSAGAASTGGGGVIDGVGLVCLALGGIGVLARRRGR